MIYQISHITRNGEKVILAFPYNQTSRAFINAFDPVFNCLVIPTNPKPVDIALSTFVQEQWFRGMMWLVKDYFKLWKDTDPPFHETRVKAHKSFGDNLIALVKLCCETLDYVPELSTDNPLSFAGQVILELKLLGMMRSHQYQGVKGKSDWDKLEAEGLAKLKKWINPYSPKDAPLMFNLIGAAIGIAQPNRDHESKQMKKRREKYLKKAWLPYLNTLRDLNTDQRDGIDLGNGQQVKFVTPQIKGDAVVTPSPKKGGRDLVTICKPQKKIQVVGGENWGRKSK